MMGITVLLVDDHAAVRESLRHLLDRHGEFEVVAEASDGRQAVDLARQLLPDVIVMDLNMPVMNGTEAMRYILDENPKARILMMSMDAGDTVAQDLLRAGAKGFVTKTRMSQELVAAVQTITEGKVYISTDP